MKFFNAIMELIKAIFSRKQTDIMAELGVKKGFFIGIGYLFYLFVTVPLRVIAYLLNPDRKLFNAVDRAVMPFMLFFVYGSGREHPIRLIFENYEKYINHLVDGTNADIKADISGVEAVISAYKIRKVLTLIVFSFLMYLGLDLLFGLFSGLTDTVASAGSLGAGIYDLANLDAGEETALSAVLGMGAMWIVAIIVGFVLLAYFAYVLMLILNFYVASFKVVVSDVDNAELESFMYELLQNSMKKAQEIYGLEIAKQAYSAILENYQVVKKLDWNEAKKEAWDA